MSEITTRQTPNIDNHRFYVDKTRNQFSPCWFVTCDRERAERILKENCKRKNGNVLMRAKRSEDGRKWKYVISTYREKRDDFLHYRILDKRDGSLKIDIDQQHQPLASLTQALDCFLEMASNKNFQLRPINLSQNSSTRSAVGSTSTVKKQSSVQQNVPSPVAAQSSAFNPADYLDMSEVVDSEQLTPPPCTDAVMQSLFNTEYLTIQDNNYSVIEERDHSNSEFYQNQAQPLNSYRNIQPNGIPSIRPRDLPYQPDPNYLQPNKDTDTRGASKRESDIYRHLLNTPTSPPSSSAGGNYLSPQSPNMGDYLTIDSTDTKTTPAKQSITSPTRQASKNQPKNSESARPSSGGPNQELNLPAHYEVPGNCRSVVKDEGGYASPPLV